MARMSLENMLWKCESCGWQKKEPVRVTCSAIAIAVTAGGVASLNSLKMYKEVSRTKNSLVFKR